MNQLMDPAARAGGAGRASRQRWRPWPRRWRPKRRRPPTARSAKVRTDIPIPPAPYLERKVRDVPHLAEVWSYINPYMLYGRHLGYKGNFEKALAEREPKALELYHQVEEVKQEAACFMKVRAVWQFFEAERDGNSIHLFAPGARSRCTRSTSAGSGATDGLCLSDYILDAEDGRRDHLALFVVTAGAGIRERSEEWKQAGEFFKAHAIQALAIETAEGTAEWLHRRIREDWGFPDPPTITMHDRFTSKYRGKRYSFGYPACPNLDDQQGLWKLLRPRRHRRAPDRRHDDGAGGQRQRAGVPPSGLRVLHRRRGRRRRRAVAGRWKRWDRPSPFVVCRASPKREALTDD